MFFSPTQGPWFGACHVLGTFHGRAPGTIPSCPVRWELSIGLVTPGVFVLSRERETCDGGGFVHSIQYPVFRLSDVQGSNSNDSSHRETMEVRATVKIQGSSEGDTVAQGNSNAVSHLNNTMKFLVGAGAWLCSVVHLLGYAHVVALVLGIFLIRG